MGALERCLGAPGGSWVVLGGSRGAPWELPGAAWEFLGARQGVLGCLWGFGGARGAKTDDSWDLFLGLLASSLAVERATGEKSVDRLTCLPGGPNRRFWGPLLGPPGKQVDCRRGNQRQIRRQSNMLARKPKRTILGTSSWASWQAVRLSEKGSPQEDPGGNLHASAELFAVWWLPKLARSVNRNKHLGPEDPYPREVSGKREGGRW